MFEQITAPDRVIALHFSGTMSVADVKQCQDVFEAALKVPGRLALVCDMSGMSDIDLDAIGPGSKIDLEFIEHIDRFTRLALVSDKQWPATIAGLATKFLPGVPSKKFNADERDAAVAWAAEGLSTIHTVAAPAKGKTRMIPTSKDDVLAFELSGKLDAESVKTLITDMQSALSRHDKVSMLGRMGNMEGFNPLVFMQHGFVGMKMAAIKHVERYALVGAPGWMSKAVETMNPLFSSMEMRSFPADQEDQAWAWLGAKPV